MMQAASARSRETMMPAALIFDIDGTVAETEEVHRQAFNAAFAAAALPWDWNRELYRELLTVAGGKERLAYYISAYAPEHGAEADIARLHADKTARYVAMIDEGVAPLRPGVARLFDEAARAGVPVAIATTTSMPNVEALFRATLGPDKISTFAAIGAGDVVPAKKPAPDIYRYVLDRLGLNAACCIAFEDSGNGLNAARAAGLATVVTPSLYTDGDDFTGALAVVSDFGEGAEPYRHVAGAGANDTMVTLESLTRWTSGG